jgi:hypothetical protein
MGVSYMKKVLIFLLVTISSLLISINSYAWVFETIADGFSGGLSNRTSLVLDSSNKAHITYYDFDAKSLKYATNKTGVWQSSTIQSGNVNDCDAPLALDSKGNVHVSYSSGIGDLMYATNASGPWATSLIEPETWTGLVGNISLAVDSNDKVHITYFHFVNFDLKYATNASGNWNTSVIINGYNGGQLPAYYTSIAADKDNYLHAVYYDETDDTIKYVTNKTGGWAYSTIDNIGYAAGWRNSIAVDLNKVVHVCYFNYGSGQAMYANNAKGTWEISAVSGIDFDMSLAVDLGSKAHITSGGPAYATNNTGAWINEAVSSSGTGVSIDTDSNNLPHLCYYSSSTLKYAYKAPEDEFPWEIFFPSFIKSK